jgi:hypothetical protein
MRETTFAMLKVGDAFKMHPSHFGWCQKVSLRVRACINCRGQRIRGTREHTEPQTLVYLQE